jgi:hypothetical protein
MLSISDVWDAAKESHAQFVLGRLDRLLAKKSGQNGYIKSPALRKFVADNRQSFGISNVTILRELIVKATKILETLSERQRAEFMKSAERVFNYSAFANKDANGWSAYKLCQKSAYGVCPYCNQAFAFTVVEAGGSFRPTLDHFFPKAEYPYLALSLYNLVPSCYTCNSNLKGTKDFFRTQHLHPLEDVEEVSFDFASSGEHEFVDLLHDDRLLEEFGVVVPREGSEKAQNSVNTFLLGARFVGNLPAIKRFVRLRKKLRPHKIEEYKALFGDRIDEATLLQFDPRQYRHQILGKILLDMYYRFEPK